MLQTAHLTLSTLHCVREKDSSSSPYLWTALVVIEESSATVNVLTPPVADDRVVIQNNLHAGQDASIPSSVGALSVQVDPATKTDLILVVALWQKRDTPGNAVDAGFNAFADALKTAITANLLNLASSDPQTQQAAIDDVKSKVRTRVSSAIENSFSTWEKTEVWLGWLTPDPLVDNSSQVFRSVVPASFTVTLGGPLGGRLLSYGDDGAPGNVSSPVVVGFGGWADFKFLFAGKNAAGEDRIYAVDQNGQLLSYGDAGTPGNVSSPVIVGFGGWSGFKFLFAGKNVAGENRIYAVDQNGQLLSYGDAGTPGNVSSPVIVGFGGWSGFKFLFAGKNAAGDDRIYAVDQTGQLLSYGDAGTPGNVSSPVIVGFGGWSDFKFLFAGRDVSGGNHIYAGEKALTPDHHYEIDGTLQVTSDVCVIEENAVNAAEAAVQDIMDQITTLQEEAKHAVGPQKVFLLKQIRDLEKNKLAPAQAALDKANNALAACVAHSSS